MSIANATHAVKDLMHSIPDKWIATFLFLALLVYHHFHPTQFVEGLINNIQGALLMGLTIGFKRLENSPYRLPLTRPSEKPADLNGQPKE